MIQPKEYFERFIAWKRHPDPKSPKVTYESYSAMDLNMLTHEMDFGIPGALEELGERYLFGLGLSTDVDKALDLFQQAADAGHPDAYHMLADVYRTDQHGRQDLDRYFELLPSAAERGSWKSMFNLACAYYRGKLGYDGHGYNLDHAAALEWSLKSAEMSRALLEIFFARPCTQDLRDYFGDVYDTFVRAVYSTAKQYMDGDGTEKNPDKARELLTSAQEFHKTHLHSECPQFAALLKKLAENG